MRTDNLGAILLVAIKSVSLATVTFDGVKHHKNNFKYFIRRRKAFWSHKTLFLSNLQQKYAVGSLLDEIELLNDDMLPVNDRMQASDTVL